MSKKPEFKKGDIVDIVADLPHAGYFRGTIVIIQDEPGKKIGIELERPAMNGHSLDGMTDKERVDPVSGTRMGRGWWAVAENLQLVKE